MLDSLDTLISFVLIMLVGIHSPAFVWPTYYKVFSLLLTDS
jgi:hypothetical protein